MLLIIFTLVTLATVATTAAIGIRGANRLKWLHDMPILDNETAPSVSIVVAARNEEKNIEEGLSSLLKLQYLNKEIIVVNDRSTDKTGDILERLAQSHPELKVIHVSELSRGWLGKNHAHWVGAKAAHFDYLLFTDADIVMDPTALSRAIGFVLAEKSDHLAIGPRALMPGIFLNIFMAGFAVFFNLFSRPWDVSNPKSKAHIGIGAFNLIKRSAYEKIGTHQALAMRPDDDMKLGKLIKRHGFKQNFLLGTDMIFVEWYDSVRALIEGLMKNAFSGVDYRISVVVGATISQIAFGLWPFGALFVTEGWVQIMNIITASLIVWVCAQAAAHQGLRRLYGFGYPIASIAFLYILWKAMLRTLIKGGIEWRGTFYPLSELKRNRI